MDGRALPRQAGVYDRHPFGQHRSEFVQEQQGGQAATDEDKIVLSNSPATILRRVSVPETALRGVGYGSMRKFAGAIARAIRRLYPCAR